MKGGTCCRISCQAPGAYWYNHSTKKYYCEDCAQLLNDANRQEAMALWGHDLCTNEATKWQRIEAQVEKLAEGHDPLWKYGQVYIVDMATCKVSVKESPRSKTP